MKTLATILILALSGLVACGSSGTNNGESLEDPETPDPWGSFPFVRNFCTDGQAITVQVPTNIKMIVQAWGAGAAIEWGVEDGGCPKVGRGGYAEAILEIPSSWASQATVYMQIGCYGSGGAGGLGPEEDCGGVAGGAASTVWMNASEPAPLSNVIVIAGGGGGSKLSRLVVPEPPLPEPRPRWIEFGCARGGDGGPCGGCAGSWGRGVAWDYGGEGGNNGHGGSVRGGGNATDGGQWRGGHGADVQTMTIPCYNDWGPGSGGGDGWGGGGGGNRTSGGGGGGSYSCDNGKLKGCTYSGEWFPEGTLKGAGGDGQVNILPCKEHADKYKNVSDRC